jgi:hypothetical protein
MPASHAIVTWTIKMSEVAFEASNLSLAWKAVVEATLPRRGKERSPIVVSIDGFDKQGNVAEDLELRARLDAYLAQSGKQSVETVANTIFPNSLWNPVAPRKQLFDRYTRLLPRLHRASVKNRRGLYFERMITGGPKRAENQLEFCLDTYASRAGVRRSILQVAVFNPGLDHSAAALLGFPCLQHVTFAPTESGLCVNAFYASQYLVERAYGNYLGLCRLGRFVAHELKIPLVRFTCLTGIGEIETSKEAAEKIVSKKKG